MLRLSVPCLFPGKQKADFYFYIGNPNTDYEPIQFQMQWLLKCRNGVADKQFLGWLKKRRRTAVKNNVDFETLCSQSPKWNNSPAPDANEPAKSDPKVVDLAEVPKNGASSATSATEAPQSTVRANLLLPLWNSDQRRDREGYRAKEQAIAHVANIILGAADIKPSQPCRYLLSLSLNYEGKSLSGVLHAGMELQEARNLTYALALIADTEGKVIAYDALEGFRRFMEMPRGDQLLAIVELRNILEVWAMSPMAGNGGALRFDSIS